MKKILNYMALHLVGNRNAKGIKISHQLRYYRRFNRMQWNSVEDNITYQRKKLFEIVNFAVNHVPYYRSLGISSFSEETIFEDIKKFPLLTKEIIRKEGTKMLPDYKIKDWIYWNQSGGTTGEPLKFCHSGAFFDEGQGIALAFDQWAGRRLGDKQVRLWGSERDIISGKKDWMNKIYRWLRNEKFLNSFMMDDEQMALYLKIIENYKPAMIYAYVQSLREMVLFAERTGKKLYRPKGIMTSAGTLSKDAAEWFAQEFKCPIINRYGSREAGPIACSCDKNEGLHINMLSNYVEILDDNDKNCEEEEEGRVILTLLNEKAMPLIRYDIGDRGSILKKKCSCGRGLQLMGGVSGRTIDFFKTEDGKKVYGDYFTHLLYTVPQVKQFQIIQDQINHVILKLVLADSVVDKSFINSLIFNIQKVLGEKVQIDIEEVKEIPVSKSGKRAYTISYVK